MTSPVIIMSIISTIVAIVILSVYLIYRFNKTETPGTSGSATVPVPPVPAPSPTIPPVIVDSDSIVNVTSFGATGNNSDDDTIAIQDAINHASSNNKGVVYFPTGIYRVTTTLIFKSNLIYYGDGYNSEIKMDRSGTFILPLVDCPATESNIKIRDIHFNHNSAGISQPAMTHTVPLFTLSCIVVQSSDTNINSCKVSNSWDNGIAIGETPLTGNGGDVPFTASIVPGMPEKVIVDNCYTEGCGVGHHSQGTELGKKGAGINNGSGSRVVISNCITYSSYNGFASDFGASASTKFIGCIANNILLDNDYPFNGSGIGYYLGSDPTEAIGCEAQFCARTGIVVSSETTNVRMTNCNSNNCQDDGIVLSGTNQTLVNCISFNNSLSESDVYSGFKISNTHDFDIFYSLSNCVSYGSNQKYGVTEESSGNAIFGAINFCKLTGNVSGETNLLGNSVVVNSSNANTAPVSTYENASIFGTPVNHYDYIGRTFKLKYPEGCLYSDGIKNCDSNDVIFEIMDAGNGKVRVHNSSDGKCLYVEDGTYGMKGWECWNDPNMEFKILKTNNGDLKLQHQASQSCVAPSGTDLATGVSCGSPDVLVEFEEYSYPEEVMDHSQFLGKNFNIKFQGDKCIFPNNIWSCWDDSNMIYKLVETGNGKIRVRHVDTGECIFIDNGNLGMKAWECWNDPNMEFSILKGSDGKLKLQHVSSSLCLGPRGTENGSGIFGYSCNNSRVLLELTQVA